MTKEILCPKCKKPPIIIKRGLAYCGTEGCPVITFKVLENKIDEETTGRHIREGARY